MPEITEKELDQSSKSFWIRARAAVQASNFEYAVQLIQAVLKECPGFVEGRKLLRNCELKLTGGGKKKGSFFGISTGGGSVSKAHGLAKKDPYAALVALEKEMEKDPTSEAGNELLFDICVGIEFFETATFALETIRKWVPENLRLMHKLATYYLTREEPALAAEVYNEILKHHPTDGAAIKGAKDASARASMKKAKWDENSDMRSLMANSAEFEELEKMSRTGLTKEQLEERRDGVIEKYNQDPNQLAVVKELAGLYEQLEDWANAYTFYHWAHTLSNGDVALATKASVMRDKAIDAELKLLQDAYEQDPENEELRAALEARQAERLADQVAEAHKRVEQNPTDPQLRYELGKALYAAGDYSAAIPHLQQATRNPHIRTKVLLLLGRTFKAKGMYDLSIKQLADALADLQTMDSTKKEVLYEKGMIHHEVGDAVAALDCFKQIYEVDYGYRDVASRVESSYQK